MDERSTRIAELLHEAAETHHRVQLDKEYTERRPAERWEDYYVRELTRRFRPS